jgi:hypothetical protein
MTWKGSCRIARPIELIAQQQVHPGGKKKTIKGPCEQRGPLIQCSRDLVPESLNIPTLSMPGTKGSRQQRVHPQMVRITNGMVPLCCWMLIAVSLCPMCCCCLSMTRTVSR